MKSLQDMLGGMTDDMEDMDESPLSGKMSITIINTEDKLDAKTNVKNRAIVISEWNLGPEKTGGDNSDYWKKMAKLWMTELSEAKRQLCANCEYFDNTPESIERMEAVPEDKFDKDGGGRGYCTKFDFICHNLRVCQAWEENESHKDYED